MSYNCVKNILGDREPPPKKQRKSKPEKDQEAFEYWNDDGDNILVRSENYILS